jgi:peptidoglycan/xylan/chitin deacetylase (PgdA/CDA1 family)
MLKTLARKGLQLADGVALIASNARAQDDALVTVLFHSLCADPASPDEFNQSVSVEDFRTFVGAMLESGYTAASPEQVDAGLARGGKHLMITFDDGYFNNTLALAVLEQFQVPATFFISSDHVLQRKAFWWDAYSRELSKAGVSAPEQQVQIRKLKRLAPRQIDEYLRKRFGESALRPQGDPDRPFTPDELKDFARSPWVHIGNHTCDHAILTNCTASEVDGQVRGCQRALSDLVGYAPIAIAYPNGNFSQGIVDASRAAGLRLGFSVLPRREQLPLAARNRMAIGRFAFEAGKDARLQCRKFDAAFVPSHAVKTLIQSRSRAAAQLPRPHHHA